MGANPGYGGCRPVWLISVAERGEGLAGRETTSQDSDFLFNDDTYYGISREMRREQRLCVPAGVCR